jgi:hypothetical protein
MKMAIYFILTDDLHLTSVVAEIFLKIIALSDRGDTDLNFFIVLRTLKAGVMWAHEHGNIQSGTVGDCLTKHNLAKFRSLMLLICVDRL